MKKTRYQILCEKQNGTLECILQGISKQRNYQNQNEIINLLQIVTMLQISHIWSRTRRASLARSPAPGDAPRRARRQYLVNTHPRNWEAAEGRIREPWALGADVGVGGSRRRAQGQLAVQRLGMDPISMGGRSRPMALRGRRDHGRSGRAAVRFGSADGSCAGRGHRLPRGFGKRSPEGSKRMVRRFLHPECSGA